jgi:hypothetical protein
MFVSAIERLGSDEQGEKWVQNARQLKMIGCYA